MRNTILKGVSIVVPALGLVLLAGAALAATSYQLQGNAQIVATGTGHAAELTASLTSPTYGSILVTGEESNPVAITALSFDFSSNAAGTGFPRLSITFLDSDSSFGNAFLSPSAPVANTWITVDGLASSYWISTGGSCGYSSGMTWAQVKGCHGGATIIGLAVTNDIYSGSVVLVDNITVNSEVITFGADAVVATSKNQCKNGGWQSVVRSDGSSFSNQGDCVLYTNTGR